MSSQIVNLLLMVYDFRGTVLILGALALHAVVGSALFQPISWHMVPESREEKVCKFVELNSFRIGMYHL